MFFRLRFIRDIQKLNFGYFIINKEIIRDEYKKQKLIQSYIKSSIDSEVYTSNRLRNNQNDTFMMVTIF